jgi:hypothetical protein
VVRGRAGHEENRTWEDRCFTTAKKGPKNETEPRSADTALMIFAHHPGMKTGAGRRPDAYLHGSPPGVGKFG